MLDKNKDFEFDGSELEDSQEFQESDEIIEIEDDFENSLISELEDINVTETIEIKDDNLLLKEDVVLSKHTIHKKHSLNYDSIFKGKREDPLSEDDYGYNGFNETFEVDKSSIYWFESVDNENYVKEKRIKEKVYDVLSKHTDLNFLNNRRKPSRSDFNHFYYLLKTNLQQENFTNVEIFNELSVYFSDNLFNMFKLLDNKWRNMIISELQEHIGKQHYSHEVINRNIHIGTEIEFLHTDPFDMVGDLIHITGVVIEADYETSIYKVDSYERVYEISINSITKILNNTKFKYNLNKLNNIDFL